MLARALRNRPKATEQREFYYTREFYRAMTETGLFEGMKVELIRGRLIEMPPISDEHGAAALRGARALRRLFSVDRFTVRPALPFIAAEDSMPEPDLCVVAGAVEEAWKAPSSCILLVEISLTTLAYDRGEHASLYAESGVGDYWIVNVADRVVEVHREPVRRADGTWAYARVDRKPPGEHIDLGPHGTIDPADLLPLPLPSNTTHA